MKMLAPLSIAALCCLSPVSSAADYAEPDILHATFIAFQQPGVFSEDYIASQKRILEDAARQGNAVARLVVDKFSDVAIDRKADTFVVLADKSP